MHEQKIVNQKKEIALGWQLSPSLPEVFSSVAVPDTKNFLKKAFAFFGPGLMIAVGYMDPGNWATDIAGGSKYGYTLLSVILFSNFFAILLQYLSLKLGIVIERDLAQACRTYYSRPVSIALFIFAEIAIIACDLAEVLGAAIALNLLFGMPYWLGVLVTLLDVFIILYLQTKAFRYIEAFVGALIFIIFLCFGYEILMSQPAWREVFSALVPRKEIFTNHDLLYLAIGILGATVMPHNLYLHSSIVQTRQYSRSPEGKRKAILFASIDSTVSLVLAFFINAFILILAAATFHKNGYHDVADISDAYHLLDPILKTATLSSTLFAIALLAAGQNSTLTGTISGQIIMEGFLNLKMAAWLRRLLTRSLAVLPALFVILWRGEKGTSDLLVLSQVVISMQLSFAVVPLVLFTSDKNKMGVFVNSGLMKISAWCVAAIIIVLNGYLLLGMI